MTRIEKKFRELKLRRKPAFIVFLTCGYPSLGVTEKLILALDKIGVDIIELGVPFSDPLADGPTIQEASAAALKNKINLHQVLRLARRIRRKTDIPLCVMTYYNPVFCFREDRFMKEAMASGVDGVIVPDLPPEEAKDLIRQSRKYGLDLVFFLSPTSTQSRVRYISRVSRGFIYYVSLTGVTGARKELPADLVKNLMTIRRLSRLPVCVGFGISTPGQVRQVYRIADGVIVGSAVIKKIKENLRHPGLVARVAGFVKTLKNV